MSLLTEGRLLDGRRVWFPTYKFMGIQEAGTCIRVSVESGKAVQVWDFKEPAGDFVNRFLPELEDVRDNLLLALAFKEDLSALEKPIYNRLLRKLEAATADLVDATAQKVVSLLAADLPEAQEAAPAKSAQKKKVS